MGSGFEFDPEAMRKLEQEIATKVQPQANAALQVAIRRVRDSYAGEDADNVYARLITEIQKETGLRLVPNEKNMRDVAQQIVDGTLEG